MAITLLGILWLVRAVLRWFGCHLLLPKTYREAEPAAKRAYEKGEILPDALLGLCWVAVGIYSLSTDRVNTALVCGFILSSAAVSISITRRNGKKHPPKK